MEESKRPKPYAWLQQEMSVQPQNGEKFVRQSAYQLGSASATQDQPRLRRQETVWESTPRAPFDLKNGMEIWQYLEIIGRWLWLIILCALVAGVCAYLVSTYLIVPVYRASVTLMVKTRGLTAQNANNSHFNDYDTFLANEDMTITFKELAQKRPVADAAAQVLSMRSDQLYGKIQIAVIPKTPLLVLSFDSTKPDRAMIVTNAFAQTLLQLTEQLEWMPGRELVIVESAEQPTTPISPYALLNTAIAAFVGGVLALAGVFGVEYVKFAKYG